MYNLLFSNKNDQSFDWNPSSSGPKNSLPEEKNECRDESTQTKIFHEKRVEVPRHFSQFSVRRRGLTCSIDEPVKKLRERLKEKALNFCVITSFDGLGHIFLSHKRNPFGWKNKVFFLAFGIFMIFNTYHMVRLITFYLQWPTVQKETRTHNYEMDFPAVTICNINKIKAGHHAPAMPPTREYAAGHMLRDMLVSCSFVGEPCYASDFRWLWSPHGGNCYTFNHHINAHEAEVPSLKLFESGKSSGLVLTLDVGSHEYPFHKGRFGMQVSVHERLKMPTLNKIESVQIFSGHWNTFRIKKAQRIGYIGHEYNYGTCWHLTQEKNREKNFYAENYTYSKTTCHRTCYQVHAMKEFQCCIQSYPCNPLGMETMFGVDLNPSIKPCKSSFPKNMTKANFRRWKRLQQDECHNGCLPECHITEYKIVRSSLGWPRKGSWDYDFHMQRHRKKYNCCENDITTLSDLQDQTMVIEIFFSTFDVVTILEVPKYKFISIFASIGAMLGAFFGFSLTTSIEIADFLLGTLPRLCHRHRYR